MKTTVFSFLFAAFAASSSFATESADIQDLVHGKVDGAEVQFAICGETPATVQSKLAARSVDVEKRDVYFLETRDRALLKSGFVARFRESAKGIKSSLKRNFETLNQVPNAVTSQMGATCELDTYLERSKVGCSIKTHKVELGDFSGKQRRFLETAGLDLSVVKSAVLVGPVPNESYELLVQNQPYTMDIVHLSDGSNLMEVSFRVPIAQATQQLNRAARMLTDAKISLCPSQTGVTKKILDHYLGAPHN